MLQATKPHQPGLEVWHFFIKLLPWGPAVLYPYAFTLEKLKLLFTEKDMNACSSIHNHQKPENNLNILQWESEWMHFIHPDNEILLSNKKEQTKLVHGTESQRHYVEWKKPVSWGCMTPFIRHSRKHQNRKLKCQRREQCFPGAPGARWLWLEGDGTGGVSVGMNYSVRWLQWWLHESVHMKKVQTKRENVLYDNLKYKIKNVLKRERKKTPSDL